MNSGLLDSKSLLTTPGDFLEISRCLEQDAHSLALHFILLLVICKCLMYGFSISSNDLICLKAVLEYTKKVWLLPHGSLAQS